MDDREQRRIIDQGTASFRRGVANLEKLVAEIKGTTGVIVEGDAPPEPGQINGQNLAPKSIAAAVPVLSPVFEVSGVPMAANSNVQSEQVASDIKPMDHIMSQPINNITSLAGFAQAKRRARLTARAEKVA